MMAAIRFLASCGLLLHGAHGFTMPVHPDAKRVSELIVRSAVSEPLMERSTRRLFNENLVAGLLVSTALVVSPGRALASGGATAGGAYLLSAKQRYNERVLKGVTGFLGVRGSLESGDIDAVRSFFAVEDVGGWKDFSAAGYLLANAFRRSSSTPPDSLPAVKKWKAFAAEVESMTKSLKKKDTKGALVAYESALEKLDDYLVQGVELSAAREAK